MVRFPQFAFRRLALRQGQSVDHPDADVLTAFGEQRLSRRERSDVLAHLAQCPECREVVALSSTNDEHAFDGSRVSAKIGPWHWGNLLWAAPAALACLLLGVIWLQTIDRKPALQAGLTASQVESRNLARLDVSSLPLKAQAQAAAPVLPRKLAAIHLRPKVTTATEQKMMKQAPAPPPHIIDPETQARATATSASFEKQDLPIEAFVPQQPVPSEIDVTSTARPAGLRGMPSAFLARLPATRWGKSLWSLATSPAGDAGPPGVIEKSNDGGKTWQSIHVDDHARFFALSANGANVWVGGADGALFHSADNGLHWTPVIVGDGTARLSGTIIGIETIGGNSVTLKVQSEAAWVTGDGGRSWRRE